MQVVPLDPKRIIQTEMEIYNYRKDQGNALVSVYGASPLVPSNSSMCGNEHVVKVVT
jgi:hypothetical protein